MVVWRLHGPWVQVMDPARGRRWVRSRELLREVYLHENRVPADDFRAWAESDGFRDPLLARLRALGVRRAARPGATRPWPSPGWQGVAALDAAARATEALVDAAARSAGRRGGGGAGGAVRRMPASPRPGTALVGEDLWTARAGAGDGSADDGGR